MASDMNAASEPSSVISAAPLQPSSSTSPLRR